MKSIVVLSDIHTGHQLAVAPPEFERSDGSLFTASKVQRALYKAWSEVAESWGKPDILVVNGEPIDGQQPKDQGVGTWTTNWLDQIDAAVGLTKMFGADRIYLTRGSNYHVNVGSISVEEIFGERVWAQRVDGVFAAPELFLEVEGVTFNFAHHIAGSASGWMYRSTPPAKEMMLAQLNQSHKWPFDVLVRSHNHYFWSIQSTNKMAVLTPCWQLQNWFAMRKSSAGTIPDIGAVRFLVEKGEITLQKKIFRMPEFKPTKVVVKT